MIPLELIEKFRNDFIGATISNDFIGADQKSYEKESKQAKFFIRGCVT